MPRLIVLTLCVQTLLQMSPSVMAKPDFGINLPVTGSAKVSLAATATDEVLNALVFNTAYTTDTHYPGLQDLANLMADVADMSQKFGEELVPLVTALVADVSNNVAGAFGPVFAKITEVKTTIATELPKANAAISTLVGHYIPDQLTDGFGRIVNGLDDLATLLNALQTALQAAVTEAGSAASITPAILKNNVKPAQVYRIVFAVNQLKAFVPEVKYTIDSTLENINLADDYLLLVYASVAQSNTITGTLQSQISSVVDAISPAVENELDTYTTQFKTVQSDVTSQLPVVTAAPDYPKLSAALNDFATHLASLTTTLYPALDGYLQALLAVFNTAVPSAGSGENISSDLLDSLILTLIENGKYAQFCFYKYYGLVLSFLSSIADNAGGCFDKEETRLTYLKDSLPSITILISFDYADILDQLYTCDWLTDPSSLSECITTLSTFYTAIATEFGHKLQYVFDLIQAETEASAERFLICIELVKFNLVEVTEPQLLDDIRQCAATGPAEDDL